MRDECAGEEARIGEARPEEDRETIGKLNWEVCPRRLATWSSPSFRSFNNTE
jgi:hypothetical protein